MAPRRSLGGHVMPAFLLVVTLGLVHVDAFPTQEFGKFGEIMIETPSSVVIIDEAKGQIEWFNATAEACYFAKVTAQKLPSNDDMKSDGIETWLASLVRGATAMDLSEVAELQGETIGDVATDTPYHYMEDMCKEMKVYWVEDVTSFKQGSKEKRFWGLAITGVAFGISKLFG